VILLSCREPKTLVVITWWQRDHMCVYSDLQQCNGCLSSELLTVYLWCYIPEWPNKMYRPKPFRWSRVNNSNRRTYNRHTYMTQVIEEHNTNINFAERWQWYDGYYITVVCSFPQIVYCDSCLLWLYLIEPRMKVVVTMTSLRLVLL